VYVNFHGGGFAVFDPLRHAALPIFSARSPWIPPKIPNCVLACLR
jgi:hypothetical protein